MSFFEPPPLTRPLLEWLSVDSQSVMIPLMPPSLKDSLKKPTSWMCPFMHHLSSPPGFVFCSLHRLPEQHGCLFDHLGHGRQEAVQKVVKLKRKVGRSCQRIGEEFSWASLLSFLDTGLTGQESKQQVSSLFFFFNTNSWLQKLHTLPHKVIMRRERTGLRKMCNVWFTADLYLQTWQQVCDLCWAWMPPYLHPETFSNTTPVNHPPQGFYISPSLHHTFCFCPFEWRFLFVGLIKVGAGLMFFTPETVPPHLSVQRRASGVRETVTVADFCGHTEHNLLQANAAPARQLSEISAQDKCLLWFLIIS